MNLLRTYLAKRRLARLVAQRRESFAIRSFVKHRNAQLRRRGVRHG